VKFTEKRETQCTCDLKTDWFPSQFSVNLAKISIIFCFPLSPVNWLFSDIILNSIFSLARGDIWSQVEDCRIVFIFLFFMNTLMLAVACCLMCFACFLMCFFSDAGCLKRIVWCSRSVLLLETGLDEVSFLIVLLRYLGGQFVGLDAVVRRSRQWCRWLLGMACNFGLYCLWGLQYVYDRGWFSDFTYMHAWLGRMNWYCFECCDHCCRIRRFRCCSTRL
jgi:hypothetical protein